MKVLILGSSGQIGNPLVSYLRSDNDVIEFDNYSVPENDLRIPNILDDWLPGVDFVFFLAFDVGGAVYLKKHQDTYEFISNNIKIMNNTFDSLRKFGTPFVFASSQMAAMSHSVYGTLKRIGENYTRCLNGKTLRLWNVYGIDRVAEKSHVITDFILMAKNDDCIQMKTDGKEMRQFLYVNDCCKCMNIVMNRFDEIKERQLDVTSFKWIKIKDIAGIISSHFNNCDIFASNDTDDIQRSLLVEPREDILKYWHPETSIEDGIKNIIMQ